MMTKEKRIEIAEHLERAACLIDEFGWTKNTMWKKDGSKALHPWEANQFCIVGALLATAKDLNMEDSLHLFSSEDAQSAVEALLHTHRITPSYWNDNCAKGKGDVIPFMLDCANDLRND